MVCILLSILVKGWGGDLYWGEEIFGAFFIPALDIHADIFHMLMVREEILTFSPEF